MLKASYAFLAATACLAAVASAETQYKVTDLPSLGGTTSKGNSIGDDGVIFGYSRVSDNQSEHAAAWFLGRVFDLGTLGGPNSDVAWPLKSGIGRIAGISQTAVAETLGENWSCAAFFVPATATGYVCRGFVWEFGHMRELPTLGGENGYAAGTNRHGQIVGWAETTLRDPTCEGPGAGKSGQVLQFLPVIYGPEPAQIRALPLISGDSSGAATAINDRGQVVGISGECDQAVGRKSAIHAVLWQDHKVIDLGGGHLAAKWWNTPTAVNEFGTVVGFLGDPRDLTGGITHAFIWTPRTGIRRLVPGDYSGSDTDNSAASSINNYGQVVGNYVAADGKAHGFVWDARHGLRDLNDFKGDYPEIIQLAVDINDEGQITGRALDPATSNRPAILLNPVQFSSDHDR